MSALLWRRAAALAAALCPAAAVLAARRRMCCSALGIPAAADQLQHEQALVCAADMLTPVLSNRRSSGSAHRLQISQLLRAKAETASQASQVSRSQAQRGGGARGRWLGLSDQAQRCSCNVQVSKGVGFP
jgi:hypothetical protein